MKKILISCLMALACISTAFASVTETKNLSHRFSSETSSSKLHINSIYGNVNITQADQDFIDVRVEITVKARNKQDAERILKGLNVEFSGKGTSCAARTIYKPERNAAFNNSGFEINYTVTIPQGARFDIINKYGNTNTGNLDGALTANIKYGNLNCGELNGKGNTIDMKYGNVTIGNTPELRLDLAYGNFKAANIASLRISSKYSNVNIGYGGNVEVSSSSYDTYSFNKVHTITSNSGTSGLSIGTLVKSIKLPGIKYGNVEIDSVEPGFENIEINSSYSGVRIRFEEPSFGYVLKAKYGDASLGAIPHNNKKELRGYTDVTLEGTAGSDSKVKVKISASYGNIHLDKK